MIDSMVKRGIYSGRSEAVRDGVRKLTLKSMIGIIPNTGDSVKEVREIRNKLSKEPFDLDEINNLGK
ncbi:MAG: ribbon-helix-helix domain-containing protein [Nanoarchaeota archaeon]|nr:ribbon-helix-helix domain-containing protein [Nanoarchaeota archaeon]MBU1598271.1 ribbon-helix-helix domain-containing protein [Nanoarchaeota archaeon]MBU2442159.1 ribbon-helix-helix domain-containing protein [Nanoarchaeota archaeon]